MTLVEPVPPTDAIVTQRAQLHTLLQRRRRLWRRIGILAAVTVAMVLVSLLNRDTQHLREQRKLGERVAAALQADYAARGGRRPLMFPVDEALRGERSRYHFNMFYDGREKTGVCCLRKPVRLFVRAEGRTVILFDGEDFTASWIPESEFRAEAEQLGFGDLPGE
jgi:hypothetical protein